MILSFNKKIVIFSLLALVTPVGSTICGFRAFLRKRPMALLAASTSVSCASGMAIAGCAQSPYQGIFSLQDRINRPFIAAAAWYNNKVDKMADSIASKVYDRIENKVATNNKYLHLRERESYFGTDKTFEVDWNGSNCLSMQDHSGERVRSFISNSTRGSFYLETSKNENLFIKVGDVTTSWSCEEKNPDCWCTKKETTSSWFGW